MTCWNDSGRVTSVSALEGAFFQRGELVEDSHEEDLQPKNKAPQVQGHHRPRVLQNPGECRYDWWHHDQTNAHLHMTT